MRVGDQKKITIFKTSRFDELGDAASAKGKKPKL